MNCIVSHSTEYVRVRVCVDAAAVLLELRTGRSALAGVKCVCAHVVRLVPMVPVCVCVCVSTSVNHTGEHMQHSHARSHIYSGVQNGCVRVAGESITRGCAR